MKAGKIIYSPVRHVRNQKVREDDESATDSKQIEHQFSSDIGIQSNRTVIESHDTVPEEVYIYDCCGVSKELSPSMEHMPIFKSLFFLFNFLVFAFGLANLGMGLWFRIDPKVYEIHKYIETQNFTLAGWIMLFCGFISCLLSIVGFAAAMRQLLSLLMFYIIVMITLTIAFIGTLVLLTVFGLGTTLEQFMMKEIYEQMRRRSMSSEVDLLITTRAAQFLDFVQVKMRCCGAADFRDYFKLGLNIPSTCHTIASNYINAPGCGRAIRELFDLRAGMATGFTSGSIVVQLLAIIMSVLMFCSIYHWRGIPRPATPIGVQDLPTLRRDSPASASLQRPRNRTPIVM